MEPIFTNYGTLDPSGLPANLTQDEAEHIAKARWDGMMDVFDARMAALADADDG